jgi:hypothetical protein
VRQQSSRFHKYRRLTSFSAGAILRHNTSRIEAHVKSNFAAAGVLSVWFVFLLLFGISGSNSPTLLAAQYVAVDDVKHDPPDKVIHPGQSVHIDVDLALVNATFTASQRLRENRLLQARPLKDSLDCKCSGPVWIARRSRSLQKISVVTWFASTREANTANEIFKAGIRAKRVEAWTKQNARVKSLFVALFEPIHGLVPVTESRVDHRNL